MVALCVVLASACTAWQAVPQAPGAPIEAPAPIPVLPRPEPHPEPRAKEPVCPSCSRLEAEISQLRRQFAETQSELSELRAQRLAQARALDEAARQRDLARAQLRSLATRAAAASYIAEVEVSMTRARSAQGSAARNAELGRAQEILDSSSEPFSRGDYGEAIERASQAAGIIAGAARPAALPGTETDAQGAVRPLKALRMRVRIDSNLRNGPSNSAAVRTVLKAGTPVAAHAHRGEWIWVEAAGGRSGWIHGRLLQRRD